MKEKLAELTNKVNAYSLRERGLIFFSVVAVFYLLWEALILGAIQDVGSEIQAEIEARSSKRQVLQEEMSMLTASIGNDPDRKKKEQLKQLQQQLNVLDQKLSELSQGLVTASQLPNVLEDVLLGASQLSLIGIQTLPVEELALVVEQAADLAVKEAQPDRETTGSTELIEERSLESSAGVFKHSVSLRVRGEYFQLLTYLKELENLPWRFYWDWLDYRVDKYPYAEIEISVYTLSAEEGLLGV